MTSSFLTAIVKAKKSLFSDKKDPPAQPDVIIRSSISAKCVVADVKYKEAPKREDINQAVTYATSFNTQRTLIIHQAKPGAKIGLSHVGNIGTISVDAYAFNLDSEHLQDDERQFAEAIFALAA